MVEREKKRWCENKRMTEKRKNERSKERKKESKEERKIKRERENTKRQVCTKFRDITDLVKKNSKIMKTKEKKILHFPFG